MKVTRYEHSPTLFFFKLDVNRGLRYFHVDVCLLGRGVEVWLCGELEAERKGGKRNRVCEFCGSVEDVHKFIRRKAEGYTWVWACLECIEERT